MRVKRPVKQLLLLSLLPVGLLFLILADSSDAHLHDSIFICPVGGQEFSSPIVTAENREKYEQLDEQSDD